MVHDGVIRRSEEEFSDVIWRGRSPAVCMLILIGCLIARKADLIWEMAEVRYSDRRFVEGFRCWISRRLRFVVRRVSILVCFGLLESRLPDWVSLLDVWSTRRREVEEM